MKENKLQNNIKGTIKNELNLIALLKSNKTPDNVIHSEILNI